MLHAQKVVNDLQQRIRHLSNLLLQCPGKLPHHKRLFVSLFLDSKPGQPINQV